MTNNGSEDSSKKLQQQKDQQKLPLIPPARMRTPSNQHLNKQQCSSDHIPATNEQNMKPREAASYPQLGAEVWSSIEDLFWDHMKEVQNKWSTLKMNDDIWAKLIYFEQNRRLAKAYVSTPVLTIDGSTNGLDGFRIGLSGIDNSYRSLGSTRCLRSIGQGVKLKIDNQGNILIRKVANGNSKQQQQQVSNMRQCSIWVKDWPGSSMNLNGSQPSSKQLSNSTSNEDCLVRELEKSDVSYKLFDMRKFRLQLEKKTLKNDRNFLDWRQCVSIISFVRNSSDESHKSPSRSNLLLEDPCWIMLINIIAIDMLKSSIICDKDNNLSTRLQTGSSNLIHQHALLESTHNHHRQNPRLLSNNESTRTNSQASIPSPSSASTKTAPRTSSKYQSYSSSSSNNNNSNSNSNVNNDDDDANLELEDNSTLATSVRTKKLRTSNNRYRMSPAKMNSHYRKYQSTQQLSSGNNTIYTTFNIINSKSKNSASQIYPFSATDNSSTSDCNSVSRNISSGNYWPNQLPFHQINPSRHRLQLQRHYRYRDDAKLVPGQGFLTTPFEPKSISLSTFDLSLKPLDLRSSIKMNYNNVDEFEDVFGYNDGKSVPFEDRFNEFPIQAQSRRAIVSLNNRRLKPDQKAFIEVSKQVCCYCCDGNCCKHGGDVEHIANDKLKHVNYKDCQSNQSKQLLAAKCIPNNNNKDVQHKKTSISSIDSSSSSSGCADNDYFISHSSSSMSSSTGSNERELFSQPASSSGIAACYPGNTSDEYDDGQKHQQATEASAKSPHICSKDGGSSSPRNASLGDLTKKKLAPRNSDIGDSIKNICNSQHKKGSRNKSLGTNGGYCCDSGLIDQVHDHDTSSPKEFSCDCPSVEVSCNCCCDCFVEQPPKVAKTLSFSSSSSKNALCEDELIYSGLPYPTDISPMASKNNNKTGKVQRNENTIARVSSTNNLVGVEYEEGGNISAIHNANNSIKTSKQSNSSWLEKRRYSKILPKFIFSSSSSNNNRQVRKPDKSTQRKSNTLERDGKFTLLKSTCEL